MNKIYRNITICAGDFSIYNIIHKQSPEISSIRLTA